MKTFNPLTPTPISASINETLRYLTQALPPGDEDLPLIVGMYADYIRNRGLTEAQHHEFTAYFDAVQAHMESIGLRWMDAQKYSSNILKRWNGAPPENIGSNVIFLGERRGYLAHRPKTGETV